MTDSWVPFTITIIAIPCLTFITIWILTLEEPPRWMKDLIFRPVLIPEDQRITVHDIATQGEWTKVNDTSIERKYESKHGHYHMTITTTRNGHSELTVSQERLKARKNYRRYKPIEKVVTDAYKMVVRHHNLTNYNADDALDKANAVSRIPTVNYPPGLGTPPRPTTKGDTDT